MTARLYLDVGGVAISAQSEFELEPLNKEYDWRFSHFITESPKKPDIKLTVLVVDELPELDESKRIFKVRHPQADADDWALYKFGKQYALEYYYTGNPGQRERVIFLNHNFDQGTAYVLPPELMPSQPEGRRPKGKKEKESKYTWNSHVVVYGFLQTLLINYFAKREGLIVHSIGLKDFDGRGLLFAGESGAGKSTTAKLWHKHSQALILNDDRMVIRRQNGKFLLYGTPWHGDFNDYLVSRTDFAPLTQMFFIHHGSENVIKPLTVKQAYSLLFPNIFPPFWDREKMEQALSFSQDLVEAVPCFEFGFIKSKDIIEIVRGNKSEGVVVSGASC